MSSLICEPTRISPSSETETQNQSGEPEEELTVTFQPPLFLQRRGWIFDVIRHESVRCILDVGCGEGEMLGCLCNPAPWLLPSSSSISSSGKEVSLDVQGLPVSDGWIRPSTLYALEPHSASVAQTILTTAPPPPREEGEKRFAWLERIRWNELEVKVWKGGLEVVNDEMINVECIVATEVYVYSTPSHSFDLDLEVDVDTNTF